MLFCTGAAIQKKRAPVPSIKKTIMKKVIATVAAFLLVGSLTMNAQQEPAKKDGEKKEAKGGEKKEHKGEKKGEKKEEGKKADAPKK
jgi:hypothetical protein